MVMMVFYRALAVLALFFSCSARSSLESRTVHLSLPARIKGLDPIQANDVYSIGQISYAYEGLLQYHYLKRPYELIPNLAEALPELSSDKRTYTFRLKKSVKFQDDPCFPGGKGRELVAEDFVYSWKRLADPKNTATGWWLLDGKVAGLNEWRKNASQTGRADFAQSVEGLQAIDSHTFKVRLKSPNALFLFSLAAVPTFVVAREAVEKYGVEFGQHPVGTGPYRLAEMGGGTKLIWERNLGFRLERYPTEGESGDQAAGLLEDAGLPLPRNERIVTYVNEESLPAWLNFLKGNLDIASIPRDSFAEALPTGGELSPALKEKGLRVLPWPQMTLSRISFNFADPLLGKNKALRRALSLAFDTAPLIQVFYNGQATPAEGPIPPGLPGYDPKFRNPYRKYDLSKATALLAEAGFPGGKGLPELQFVSVAASSSRQIDEYIKRQFAQIGVRLKVESYSWPEFVMRVKNRQGQLWSFGWMAQYPDAENFLQLFYGKNVAPGPNDMNYMNLRSALRKGRHNFRRECAPCAVPEDDHTGGGRCALYFLGPWAPF
jgi:oligopeptide transport system substrate-binding protein